MSVDEALIKSLGGATRVAELLGYDRVGGVQRVHNWCKRGIPARIKLQYPDLFLQAPPLARPDSSQQPATQAANQEARDAA